MTELSRIVKIDRKLILYLALAGLLPFIFYFSERIINGSIDKAHVCLAPETYVYDKLLFLLINLLISCGITVTISLAVISQLNWLERKYPWSEYTAKRLFLELLISNVTSASIMTVFGWIALHINGLEEGYTLSSYYFQGIATAVIMNLILTTSIECVNLFGRWKESLVLNERLQKEMYQTQYQVLKTQVNPHFLFNSLNVLSSLVHTDANKAEEFIDEFARVYRYILEVNSTDLVTLEQEADVVRSYVFLQQIRFSEGLCVTITIANDCAHKHVPALALQLLVENAIKHNVVSTQEPLLVEVYCEQGYVVVRNNYQPRSSNVVSTGLGQKNLEDRFAHYSTSKPEFYQSGGYYLAKLPLVK